MRIYNALEEIKNLKPSQYGDDWLIGWLSTLDGQVYEDLLARYGAPAPKLPYRAEMLGAELVIPAPHDRIYITYLGAQIDYANAEYERYNNGMMMFNAQLQAFYNAYTRTHIVKKNTVIKGVKAL